ncbi:uncharacterized protein LOC5511746 isoform X2 [Nematostella vectensis]|uniref:uncharacterized protein LOC5511746 isoform X2 n=1 Tax=Nematostella vectensis TaxID=45351 RepID=UPI002077559A|nr:uncharacterized protein LOC5511746 isoform X2 [Nematostella vectensis]
MRWKLATWFVFGATFALVSSEVCDKSTFIPKALVCQLNIFIHSNDTGQASLLVNDKDYMGVGIGIYLAAFHLPTGNLITSSHHAVDGGGSVAATSFKDALLNLPNNTVVVLAVKDSGNDESSLNVAHDAMREVGIVNPDIKRKDVFTSVTCKGCYNAPFWPTECKRSDNTGDCFSSVSVPVNHTYAVSEFVRTPYGNVASIHHGATCNASTEFDVNYPCTKAIDGNKDSEWRSKGQGVGASINIELRGTYLVNMVRIYQRIESASQSQDVRIEFSDCSVISVKLENNLQDFNEFHFSSRLTSWVKLLVSSVYTTQDNGFKEIEFLYYPYDTGLACERTVVGNGVTSHAIRILGGAFPLAIKSSNVKFILAKESRVDGPRLELEIDSTSNNVTTLRISSADGSETTLFASLPPGESILSSTGMVFAWFDAGDGYFAFGIGEETKLFFPYKQEFDLNYIFFKSLVGETVVDVCHRKVLVCEDAALCMPLRTLSGSFVFDSVSAAQGRVHGAAATTTVGPYTALSLDGSSTFVDGIQIEDRDDAACFSNPEMCLEGLSGSVFLNFLATGEGYYLSTGSPENDTGIYIYSVTNSTLRVDVRTSNWLWRVEANVNHGLIILGFSWEESEGLTVVNTVNSASTVYKDTNGAAMTYVEDTYSTIILGRPHNVTSKYGKGSLGEVWLFSHAQTEMMLKNIWKGSATVNFPETCFTSGATPALYYPGNLNEHQLSPFSCSKVCGEEYYKKAVIWGSLYCGCTNDTSSFVSVGRDRCYFPCIGNQEKKCGGAEDYIIFDTVSGSFSLNCDVIPSSQNAFQSFEFNPAATTTYLNLILDSETFLEPDGSATEMKPETKDLAYLFTSIGVKATSVEAMFTSNETGEPEVVRCKKEVTVAVEMKNFSFECLPFLPSLTWTCCDATFTQGSGMTITVDWKDGSSVENLKLSDSTISSAGAMDVSPIADQSVTAPGFYILPQEDVEVEGKLIAVCANIKKSGLLSIKVCRPFCNAGHRFCSKQKKCIPESTFCIEEPLTCASPYVFSPTTSKCEQRGWTTPAYKPLPEAEDVSYKCNVAVFIGYFSAGQKCLMLTNQTASVEIGDIVGVDIPDTESRANVGMTSRQGSFRYDSLNETDWIGYRNPAVSGSPKKLDKGPQVKIKYLPKIKSKLCHTFTKTGTFATSMSIASGGGGGQVIDPVTVQEPVANATFEKTTIPTNAQTNISLASHPGSDVTYFFILGDKNYTTNTPWVLFSCNAAGDLNMTVFAKNNVSVSYSVCEGQCQDPIDGLGFSSDALIPVMTGSEAQIKWYLNNGSHVNFDIDPGDETGVKNLTNAKVPGAYFVAKFRHNYTTAGTYLVNITACNAIGCKTITGYLQVQDPIANITITYEPVVPHYEAANLSSTILSGTNVSYVWKLDNVTIANTTDTSFMFTPHEHGIFNLTLFAFNEISSAVVRCSFLEVQEKIALMTGEPIEPAGVGHPAFINFKIENGTSICIHIDYGDGQTHQYNCTGDAFGTAFYIGAANHTYMAPGNYCVNVTASNKIGQLSIVLRVIVDEVIEFPGISISRNTHITSPGSGCDPPLHVPTNEAVYMFYSIVNGTNVIVDWDFGDTNKLTNVTNWAFPSPGVTVIHTYTAPGNYSISVNSTNSVSNNLTSCHVVVEDPVVNIVVTSNSPRGYPLGDVIVTTTTLPPHPSGPVHCVANFSDGSTSGSTLMTFSPPLQVSFAQHNLPSKGAYYVTVNCSNHISWKTASAMIEVQDVVLGLSCAILGTANYSLSERLRGSEGYDGPGMNETIFPVEHDVNFTCNITQGSNLTYTYTICDGRADQQMINSSVPLATHKFPSSAVGECIMKVNVSNDVSWQVFQTKLTVEQSVVCKSLTNTGNQEFGIPITFVGTFTAVGTNTGCLLSFDDGQKKFVKPSSSSAVTSVPNLGTILFSDADKKFQTPYLYATVGTYYAELECWNRVSWCLFKDLQHGNELLQNKAITLRQHCDNPVPTINNIGNQTHPTREPKWGTTAYPTSTFINCSASSVVTFKWEISKCEDPKTVLNISGIDVSLETFVSPPRALDYGCYVLHYIANHSEVPDVYGEVFGYLLIYPSDLVAEIAGGDLRTIGSNKSLVFDGTNSRDPDFGKTILDDPSMKCYWYCYRHGDNYTFPERIDTGNLSAPVQDRPGLNKTDLGGCFGDGAGRLNRTACTFQLDTGRMKENNTYEMRLFVVHTDGRQGHKTQQVTVTFGDPPSMFVKFLRKNHEKLNPNEKTSLYCSCPTCLPGSGSLEMKWSICKYNGSCGIGECEELDQAIKNQILLTPDDRPNLVVKSNGLEPGLCYKFQCQARRTTGEVTRRRRRSVGEPMWGSASAQANVNAPPQGGRCVLTPNVVEVFTKQKFKCTDWVDEDLPLHYVYGTSSYEDQCRNIVVLESQPSTENEKEFTLPPGKKENNFTLCGCVQIKDKSNAVAVSGCIPTQVKEPENEVPLSSLNDTMMNLASSGSTEQALAYISSVGIFINVVARVQITTSGSTTGSGGGSSGSSGGSSGGEVAPTLSPEQQKKATEERTELRTVALEMVAKMTVATPEAAIQTTQTLTVIISGPAEEISSEGLRSCVSTVSSITTMLQQTAGRDPNNAASVQVAAAAVVQTVGHIVTVFSATTVGVSSRSSGSDPNLPTTLPMTDPATGEPATEPTGRETISQEEAERLKATGTQVESAIRTIASIVIGNQGVGENATTISSPGVTLSVQVQTDLNNLAVEMSGGSFTCPSNLAQSEAAVGVGDEASTVSFASVSMVLQGNIFNWHPSAAYVKSSNVVSLELKNQTDGTEMSFNNTSDNFEIWIGRAAQTVRTTTHTLKHRSFKYQTLTMGMNDSSLHIIFHANACTKLKVLVKKGGFPNENDYDFNMTLPREDSGVDYNSTSCNTTVNATAYTVFFSNEFFNRTAAGVYTVGFLWEDGADHLTDLNVTLTIFTSSCRYWDNKMEQWSSAGCVVDIRTRTDYTLCLCNHLTSFASGMFVPPNTIDWDKFLAFDLSQGYVCFATVLTVIGLYLVFLIPARKADKADAEKTGVTPIPDNDPRDTYCYEIHIHTGFIRGAGTSADVSIVLNGAVADSDPRVLKDPKRKVFKTGGVDAFLLTVPQSLGNLKNIRLWHNNGGAYPSWNLLRVMIQDLQTDQRWWFVCDDWLAVDEGDGKIDRVIYPATKNELTKFNVLFATEVRKNLTDGHLWFSVVTRPANSPFTRVQRLTCCLSILLCTMLANLMFYRSPSEGARENAPTGSIQIAGFTFSLEQISIGITSSLVVFPANLIVVQLFRKARAKETKMDLKAEQAVEEFDDIAKEKNPSEEMKEAPKTKKEGIPHWCVYIAYSLALLSSLAASVVIMAYGFTFGPEKSAQWLLSMSISFFQDVLVSQPIKVFLLASIFALLIKDPNKAESDPLTDVKDLSQDEEWLHDKTADLDDDTKMNLKKMMVDRPPDEAKLEIARQLRFKERQMASIMREIVWYLIFLFIVLSISYGNRDPYTQLVTNNVENVFLQASYNGSTKFDEIGSTRDYWPWLKDTVIPSIFIEKWYNDQDYHLGYLADTPTAWVLAVARLRQLRMQKHTCPLLPALQHVIPSCNDFYSSDEEERGMLLPGWKEPVVAVNSTPPPIPASRQKTAWQYQTGEELKTFPYWGQKATYSAGGYVQVFPPSTAKNYDKAQALADALNENDWLDKYTRAVFTEFSIYNANSNLFCVVTLLIEQLPTGGIFKFPSILTLRLYRYVGGEMFFVAACEIIYLLFTAYFIFREIKQAYKLGLDKLKNPWSILEIFVTCLSLSMVVLYFLRIKFTAEVVKDMRNDPTRFVSLHYTAFLDEWIKCLMGLIVFFSFIKIVRLLRFNRRMSLLAQTLKLCIPKIGAFVIVYGIAFFAYAQLACLVFGQNAEGFMTIPRSAATLMDTLLGKFTLKEMSDINRLIGPTFFYIYTLSMIFILINMFMSIINDSFAEVNSDVSKQANDYEIVDFMIHRLKENIGKTMGSGVMPVYKEPKSKLERDFDEIEEHADNIMHYMRNMAFENMRHTRWFDNDTAKEKKKKMFELLMQVDWDYFEDELGDGIPVFEDFLQKHDEAKLDDVLISFKRKKELDNEGFEYNDDESSEAASSDDDDDDDDDDDSDDSEDNDSNDGSDYVSRSEDEGDYTKFAATLNPTSARPRTTDPADSTASTLFYRPKSAPDKGIATDQEIQEVLGDVETENARRCVTDAELKAFLPELTALNDDNQPTYDGEPEKSVKKKGKKKKNKKKKGQTPMGTRSAWDLNDQGVENAAFAQESDHPNTSRITQVPFGSATPAPGQVNQGYESDLPLPTPTRIRLLSPVPDGIYEEIDEGQIYDIINPRSSQI